jgi:predicted transcriptional regulator
VWSGFIYWCSVTAARGEQTDSSRQSWERKLVADTRSNIELAAAITAAYVSNNSVRVADLPGLFGEIHSTLGRISSGIAAVAGSEEQTPAVPAKKSITNDHLVCLEDGRKFKSLKRHLRADHDMSPAQYREKWHLAADYPMVAPAYAKARSALAISIGLGQKRRPRKKADAPASKATS